MADKIVTVQLPQPKVELGVVTTAPPVQVVAKASEVTAVAVLGKTPQVGVSVHSGTPEIQVVVGVPHGTQGPVGPEGPQGPAGPAGVLDVLGVLDGDVAPAPADPGWAWSSVMECPVFWDGGRWRRVPPLSIGPTPPTSPKVGHVWITL